MTKPVKAYAISDGDEDAQVLFVADRRAARRIGAEEYDIDPADVVVDRARAFDQYAPGPVPPLALINFGWWLECWGCGCRIDSDLTHEVKVIDPDGRFHRETRTLAPVERGDGIYCTPECMASSDRRQTRGVSAPDGR